MRLCDLFAADPVIGAAWGLKEAFRSIYCAEARAEACFAREYARTKDWRAVR